MDWLNTITHLFGQGGWVMYPLGLLSVLSVGLTLERALFWLSTNTAGDPASLRRLTAEIRRGDLARASKTANKNRSVYGVYASELIGEAQSRKPATPGHSTGTPQSFALERAEAKRPAVERWATVHSVIITAAPMLGILGTVTGIIRSFNLLGADEVVTDPAAVAGGIAEALFTTAVGLVVALVTLFPHALFRAQADRALTKLELIAAAMNDSPGQSDHPSS